MTTLDAHDFKQEALAVPLRDMLDFVNNALTIAAPISVFVMPAATAALTTTKLWLGRLLTLVDVMGVALNIPYDDFKDPDVKRWTNIGYLDNYYQTAGRSTGITATPNGRFIESADLNFFMNGIAGFTGEDFGITGVGGPHSRVWQWYAGTAGTNLLTFDGNPVFRRIVDEGISTRALGIPVFDFNAKPWYWTVPGATTDYLVSSAQWTSAGAIWEGIGTGWYYSGGGGSGSNRPIWYGDGVPLTDDNTEVTKGPDAVPNVFNGNFEHGTRQSLLNRLLPGADKYRFPLSYELPGWSFHGGEGFNIDFGPVGTLDIGGLFVFETNVGALATGALRKIWDLIVDKTIGALAAKAKLDFLGGEPKKPDASSSQGYRDWYELNWGDNSENRKIFNANSALYDLAAGVLDKLIDAGAAIKPIQDLIKVDPDKKLNPLGVDNFKEYMGTYLEQLFKDLFKAGSNYALMMGASSVVEDFLRLTIGDVAGQFVNDIIAQIADLDTITHNRVMVPADEPLLAFSVVAPVMVTPAKLKVRFLATELDPDLQDSEWLTVELEPSFFSRHTYAVPVPEEFKGKVALLQFQHADMEGSTRVVFDEGDTFADPNFPTLIGQVYFLDDIRFSKGLEVTVTPVVNEGDSATLDVEWVPADPALETTITVSWRDGTPIETRTVGPGVRTASFSHIYADDDPNGTAADPKSIVVTANNVVGADTATARTEIRNVDPRIESLQLESVEIDEGEDAGLTIDFDDVGVLDEFRITIDWGDGSTPTVVEDLPSFSDGGSSTLEKSHTYKDDDPTATPHDSYTIRVTLEDDDGGRHERTIAVRVDNVDPVIEQASLDVTSVEEGEQASLTVEYSDEGLEDTLRMELEWPDGVTETHTLALDPQGRGTITVTHLLADDDPTHTPQDLGQVKIRIIDDDRGEATRELDLTVVNVEPTISAAFLTPEIDEGGTAELQVDIDDPSDQDTFTVFIDWDDGLGEQEYVGVLGSQTFSYQYLDDDPSGTTEDTRNVTVRVVDDDSGEATADAALVVKNVAPVAIGGGDVATFAGGSVTLLADQTDVGELDTFTYEWTVVSNDTGAVFGTSTLQNPTFTFLVAGTYTATLVVTDDDGSASDPVPQQIVVIEEEDPDFEFLWNVEVTPEASDEGGVVTVTVEVFGVSIDGQYDLDIDFGDGQTLTEVQVGASDFSGKTTLTFTHRYADDRPPGDDDEYQIGVKIYFSVDPVRARLDETSKTVAIANADPVVSIAVTPPATPGARTGCRARSRTPAAVIRTRLHGTSAASWSPARCWSTTCSRRRPR